MPGGRPTSLTKATGDRIIQAVRIGSTLDVATGYASVSRHSLARWRRIATAAEKKPANRRSQHERRCVEFCTALDVALNEATVAAQAAVFEAMSDPGETVEDRRLKFRAAAWYLTHRHSGDYHTRAEVTGAEGGPIELSADQAFDILSGRVAAAKAEPVDED